MTVSGEGQSGAKYPGAQRSLAGIRLYKRLGSVGIIIGAGMAVSMPFLDVLGGIRVSGALSLQDMGILSGILILLVGLLLYLSSMISYMELRLHELATKAELGPAPVAAPTGPAAMTITKAMRVKVPAARPDEISAVDAPIVKTPKDTPQPATPKPVEAEPGSVQAVELKPAPAALVTTPSQVPSAEIESETPRPKVEKPRPAIEPVPRFESGISGCPRCGRKTMRGWKKCPHCLAELQQGA